MANTIDRIAEFVLHYPADDMPQSTRNSAALMLLDTLGIVIGSGQLEAGSIARDTATLLYGTSDDAFSARMMFDGRKVSMAGAAYAAATQTDNLDGLAEGRLAYVRGDDLAGFRKRESLLGDIIRSSPILV